MARRKAAEKREVLPDPKYGSEKLSMFINVLMVDGKKSVAEKVVYRALENAYRKHNGKKVDDEDESGTGSISVSEELKKSLMEFFDITLDKVIPNVEVRSRRVGGATYQVPVEVRASRGLALAMRWIIQSARKRSEKGMIMRLCNELLDANQGRGAAVKKREDTHRMAKANQAFAHFRW